MPQEWSTGVVVWWAALSLAAIVNVGLWSRAVAALRKEVAAGRDPGPRRFHVWLSAGFVFGCAFRSFVPRADVQRICLIDSWIASVMVGRAVATVAELCFMGQCALYLFELAQEAGVAYAVVLSRLIVPLIAIAECCSWYAVLTTNYLGNALEESLWTLSAALLVAGILGVRARRPQLGRFLSRAIVVGLGYVVFMCTVDVPMYVSRYRADQAAAKAYLGVREGLRDVALRWVVTHRWEDWHEEMAWMALYFSVAVWMSIALMRAPRPRRDDERVAAVSA
jgi:hypothetical protein